MNDTHLCQCCHKHTCPCSRCKMFVELLEAVKKDYATCAPLSTRGRALAALIAKAEGKG